MLPSCQAQYALFQVFLFRAILLIVMGLDANEKAAAKSTMALALELNEPESLVSSLRLMCERKAEDWFQSDNERSRWKAAEHALAQVAQELDKANEPQTKAEKPNFAAEQSDKQ